MSLVKHIPNTLTLGNLFMGCLGLIQAFNGNLEYASYAIWLAAIFDFFDGFAARLLKVSSPIGKELDSLADMVTFGVLPAVMVFQLTSDLGIYSYAAFIIALFSALRLAKFNIDDEQSTGFIGLPTPALAFFVSGLPFGIDRLSWLQPEIILALGVLLAFLLISPLKMLALKFENYRIKDNIFKYLLILGSIVLIVVFKTLAIPLIILYYILLSLVSAFAK